MSTLSSPVLTDADKGKGSWTEHTARLPLFWLLLDPLETVVTSGKAGGWGGTCAKRPSDWPGALQALSNTWVELLPATVNHSNTFLGHGLCSQRCLPLSGPQVLPAKETAGLAGYHI